MERDPRKEIAPLAATGEAKEVQLQTIREKYKSEACTAQAQRLLEALKLFPISTVEARRLLDVMHPAGRIKELREDGHAIHTLRKTEPSDIGRPHSMAVYVLMAEA